MHRLSTSLAALVLAGSALAQFDRNIGTSILPAAPNDDIIINQALTFPFTWPDGSTSTDIDIDTNGRILQPGANAGSAFGADVAQFLDELQIAVWWTDVTPTGLQTQPRGSIFFNDDGAKATITWCNVKSFGGTVFDHNEWTFQAQLFANGNITLTWDERVFATRDILVGVSGVFGSTTTPTLVETDLGAGGATTPGSNGSVFEFFDTSDSPFDLFGKSINFVRSGSNYSYTVVDAGITPCGAERFGLPCPVSFEFFPNFTGGYTVTRPGAARFIDDMGQGTELANAMAASGPLGDDSITAPQPLPAAWNGGQGFPWPGGTFSADVTIDNNGRVLADPSDSGDFNASVEEFLNWATQPDPTAMPPFPGVPAPPQIAAFWGDLSAQRGSLRIWHDTGSTPDRVVITWDETPKFYESVTHTFQVVLYELGNFELNYKDVSLWQTGSGFTSDHVLIGCSPGNNHPDPGEVDFSDSVFDSGTEPAVYEFWNANTEIPDIHTMLWPHVIDANDPRGHVWTEPRSGAPFTVTMSGIPSGTVSANLLFGVQRQPFPIPLDLIGATDCTLIVNPLVPAIPVMNNASIATFSLPIGSDPSLIGLATVFQGVNIVPGSNNLGIELTNAVQGVIQP